MKNPPWQRDELILALDLYFKTEPNHINATRTAVTQLSKVLNSLPIHKERPDKAKFRNPNSVYMKLSNFSRYDPDYTGKSLQRGGKLEEAIWTEFHDDRERLRSIAQVISDTSTRSNVAERIVIQEPDDEENEFPEGKVLYRLHKMRERNSKAIRAFKQKASAKGELHCQVCGFDFTRTYGEVGSGYIECHHTVPVSEYKNKKSTTIDELVLVCANCHRMLHRKRPWLSIGDLSKLILKK